MNKRVYEFNNYKDFLKFIINSSERGIVKRLSNAAGCQRSYVSQALNGHVHLTNDQLYLIGDYLNLNNHEIDYLLLLLEKDKAATRKYKDKIDNKIADNLLKANRLTKRLKKDSEKEINNKYYSAWYYQAIHIATSIENLRTASDISKLFNLSVSLIEQVLLELKEWNLVIYENFIWNYKGSESIHLEDSSYLSRLNHVNWRTFAMGRPLKPNNDVHYTSTFAISKKDIPQLRDDLFKFIENQRNLISNSGPEEVVNFCCDFFRVSE
jgi:transcription initiation factor IIE alpha subunit